MDKYLELKFGNEFNEKMSIKLNNYDVNKGADDVDTAMDSIIASNVFKGKKQVYNKKLSADIVTVERQALDLK